MQKSSKTEQKRFYYAFFIKQSGNCAVPKEQPHRRSFPAKSEHKRGRYSLWQKLSIPFEPVSARPASFWHKAGVLLAQKKNNTLSDAALCICLPEFAADLCLPQGSVFHSNSTVAGGLPVQSYSTRLMCGTSLTMRRLAASSTSHGRRAASAVMKSAVSTARSATA